MSGMSLDVFELNRSVEEDWVIEYPAPRQNPRNLANFRATILVGSCVVDMNQMCTLVAATGMRLVGAAGRWTVADGLDDQGDLGWIDILRVGCERLRTIQRKAERFRWVWSAEIDHALISSVVHDPSQLLVCLGLFGPSATLDQVLQGGGT